MNIAEALNRVAEAEGLSDTAIAATVGVSSISVTRWRAGTTEPRSAQFMALRRAYPKFADLMDGKVAA